MDKSLGLCIIECDEYIQWVLTSHLLDMNSYHHLPFHKACNILESTDLLITKFIVDPPRHFLQHVFQDTLLHPPDLHPLPTLCNFEDTPLNNARLDVAYHQLHNLKPLLFPCKLCHHDGKLISSYLPSLATP